MISLSAIDMATTGLHDALWVIVHASVAKVEPLHVRRRSGFDSLGVPERSAQLRHLREVVTDERALVVDGEVFDSVGRGWRRRRVGRGGAGGGGGSVG